MRRIRLVFEERQPESSGGQARREGNSLSRWVREWLADRQAYAGQHWDTDPLFDSVAAASGDEGEAAQPDAYLYDNS